ncbi:MAG: LAGLIDADG family homing endonuclease [Sinimarinibacterium sp.]
MPLRDLPPLPLQEASELIARGKYFLPDETLDGMRRRLARTLARTEARPEQWEELFYRALHYAFPGGRIMANAGAEDFKPNVSTINCTVSRTIDDSMAGIMQAAADAALTLRAGCGIGYDFSTLRPRGAPVSGAGATTSGPLPFMDVFDAICRTVSSAGGRRGAQMGCLDIGHPDIEDFIVAKREAGRLRAFNLSCLISDDFIAAVREDREWPLAFPAFTNEVSSTTIVWRRWPLREPQYTVNERGETACRVYRQVSARALWDLIMRSTYAYSDPGFILIDEYNRMNPLWFCENIRATNPCVTADTRLHTQFGMIPIGELHEGGQSLDLTVDSRTLPESIRGTTNRPAVPAFMTSHAADVYRVTTREGYEIKATAWHEFYTQRGKIQLKDIKVGDELLIQSGKGQFGTQGSKDLGTLIGLITGDGHFTTTKDKEPIAYVNFWGEDRVLAAAIAAYVNSLIANTSRSTTGRVYEVRPIHIEARNHAFIGSVLLARYLEHFGFTAERKFNVPEVVWRGTEDCAAGYLRGLFQADGTVNVSGKSQTCSVRLASSQETLLKDVQVLLANFGIFSRIHQRRPAKERTLPDGKGGSKIYQCRADYELIIDGESRDRFMAEIGFLTETKAHRYHCWIKGKRLYKTQGFRAKVQNVCYEGRQAVYDTTQPDHNSVIFNGIVTGQCGEQGLPPFGSCLLGSVNLASLVKKPFTADAQFDFETYADVVRVFARMLDNVIEIHGLPLPQQRDEIHSKRRHGMGYLGLGSALTMLGIRYGSKESVEFTERITRSLAVENWRAGLELAREKGPAPVLSALHEITPEHLALRPELARDGHKLGDKLPGRLLHARYSRYFQRFAEIEPALVAELADVGARYTHATSIAPTGTMAASVGNNASNGIEPSFGHSYTRNMIVPGEKAKRAVRMESYELLAYRYGVDPQVDAEHLPQSFSATAAGTDPKEHVDVQAAAQRWIDSSISKTINVPSDIDYEAFKDLYHYAIDRGLKGCTTFRFNPEVHQGVLVADKDLAQTTYEFRMDDGTTVRLPGNAKVEYEGGTYSAANLYDALKEGFYGKL